MSKRRWIAVVTLAGGVFALLLAGAVVLVGGSATVAWMLTSIAAWTVVFAASLALGLDVRVERASPRAKSVLLAMSGAVAVAGGVVYAVWPSATVWWVAQWAFIPLALLLLSPAMKPRGRNGGGDAGPFAPP